MKDKPAEITLSDFNVFEHVPTGKFFLEIGEINKYIDKKNKEAVKEILERIDEYRDKGQYRFKYNEAGILHKVCLEIKEIIKSKMGENLSNG